MRATIESLEMTYQSLSLNTSKIRYYVQKLPSSLLTLRDETKLNYT